MHNLQSFNATGSMSWGYAPVAVSRALISTALAALLVACGSPDSADASSSPTGTTELLDLQSTAGLQQFVSSCYGSTTDEPRLDDLGLYNLALAFREMSNRTEAGPR